MARSHSSYTASPTRHRSPQRSPARRPSSEEGSQYELDLDALGMNSTFDSTELDDRRDLNIDVVDTSDIEGPEDFTMNMTYWMTADLSPSKIKSRKEATIKVQEVRGDARYESHGTQDTIEEGDEAMLEESSGNRQGEEDFDSASPTMRANGSTDGRQSHDIESESSMENEEKVMSYLDALPDTEVADAIKSTPLRVQNRGMLHVPKQSAQKARSLQPTVEDYDTPRKPTQDTVIHYIQESMVDMGSAVEDTVQSQIAELRSQLEQQELASKTRITELETILSFTRSELETARTTSYKQKEEIARLERDVEAQKRNSQSTQTSVDKRLQEQEEDRNARMQEFGEELRLQNLAKLQSQREEFELQLRASEEAKRAADEQARAKDLLLQELRSQVHQLKQSKAQELENFKMTHSEEQEKHQQNFTKERTSLNEKLSAFQARADSLQADLERATAEAKVAREGSQNKAARQATTPDFSQADVSDKSNLKARIQSLETQLHASRTDIATKDRELLRISDLESRIQSLLSQLDSAQVEITTKAQELQRTSALETRLQSLQSQLDSSRAGLTAKEQELLRKSDLESQIQTLHSQLSASRAEITAKDQDLLQKSDLESRILSLQTQLTSSRSNLTSKDQELLRYIEEQERLDQRLNAAQGRIEGLENTISTIRQQLAEAHRQSSKARTDVERYEKDLEDANDRLQDAGIEADRRVADIERKLGKLKDQKTEAERMIKELRSEQESVKEDHEAQLEDVRSAAEDAVRKAGAIVEQERTVKKKLVKELKTRTVELENLRAEAVHKVDEEEESDDESTASSIHSDTGIRAKESEIENLRGLVREQASAMKKLRSETASLRKANTILSQSTKTTETEASTISTLRAELATLRQENTQLRTEATTLREDFEAVNKAMDERLASMLSQLLKERTKTAVGKRDGQWLESVGKKVEKERDERELMSKMLMREWGRQEVGIAKEEQGEKQSYRYKYVKRT